MNQKVKLGQRWMWTNSRHEYVVEVIALKSDRMVLCQVVQIIGDRLWTTTVGQQFELVLEDYPGWILLKGQDKSVTIA